MVKTYPPVFYILLTLPVNIGKIYLNRWNVNNIILIMQVVTAYKVAFCDKLSVLSCQPHVAAACDASIYLLQELNFPNGSWQMQFQRIFIAKFNYSILFRMFTFNTIILFGTCGSYLLLGVWLCVIRKHVILVCFYNNMTCNVKVLF